MSKYRFSSATFSVGPQPVSFTIEPLSDDEPMGDQRLYISYGASDTLTLILSTDQADQLEHELERGRWHRVFLMNHTPKVETLADGTEVVTKPDDEHSGGWTATIPPAGEGL